MYDCDWDEDNFHDELDDSWHASWLSDEDDEDWDEPANLEMGFNPYIGCYDYDC